MDDGEAGAPDPAMVATVAQMIWDWANENYGDRVDPDRPVKDHQAFGAAYLVLCRISAPTSEIAPDKSRIELAKAWIELMEKRSSR